MCNNQDATPEELIAARKISAEQGMEAYDALPAWVRDLAKEYDGPPVKYLLMFRGITDPAEMRALLEERRLFIQWNRKKIYRLPDRNTPRIGA